MMVRLVYVSRSGTAVDRRLIDAIISRSKNTNPAVGVTGVLCYTGELFMQVLEGGREAVNRLYNDIARDERHREVTLIEYTEITERQFANWTMGEVNLEKVNPSVLLRHAELPTLDPYQLGAKACAALVQDLLSSAVVVSRSSATH